MLRKGQQVVVKMDAGYSTRTICVRASTLDDGFNVLEYGINSLDNDFNETLCLRAALRAARTDGDVVRAMQRYAKYPAYRSSVRVVQF